MSMIDYDLKFGCGYIHKITLTFCCEPPNKTSIEVGFDTKMILHPTIETQYWPSGYNGINKKGKVKLLSVGTKVLQLFWQIC